MAQPGKRAASRSPVILGAGSCPCARRAPASVGQSGCAAAHACDGDGLCPGDWEGASRLIASDAQGLNTCDGARIPTGCGARRRECDPVPCVVNGRGHACPQGVRAWASDPMLSLRRLSLPVRSDCVDSHQPRS